MKRCISGGLKPDTRRHDLKGWSPDTTPASLLWMRKHSMKGNWRIDRTIRLLSSTCSITWKWKDLPPFTYQGEKF